MDTDRGYAWILLGASTVLMCIGPSTFTSTGFLLYNASDNPISPAHQSWILSLFYCCWTLSAFLAACLVKQRPRQLATGGAVIACIGFISSASAVKEPTWLYLTFSLLVGIGLGSSFHTAYLVVMSNFDRYKGLANGVCITAIAIGQLISPFLFTIVSQPKDRFHIKSLTGAVGFLTTLFFVVPTQVNPRQMSIVGERNRRNSSVSRRSSQGEGVPLHSGFIPTGPSSNIPINNQGIARTRRRSQYLLAVSSSLLPNIPEEPESTHSTNDTLTSASSESSEQNLGQSVSTQSITIVSSDSVSNELKFNELNPKTDSSEKGQVEGTLGSTNPKEINANQHIPLRRVSESSMPTFVEDLPETKSGQIGNGTVKQAVSNTASMQTEVAKPAVAASPTTPKYRRFSESQLQSPHPAASPTGRAPNAVNSAPDLRRSSTESNKSQSSKKPMLQSKPGHTKGESIIDFSLLQDVHFVNMAAFSSLCTVTLVNFPIVLYFYISDLCEDCAKQANMAMVIIYVVDLISRIVFSYISDMAIMTRRRMFLVGCLCGGILIAAIPLMKDFTLIYCNCVLFGICFGMLATSEHLMFIETFGAAKFPQAYGFVNLFKLVAVTVLGVFIMNPMGAYLYPIHPFDVAEDPKNLTLICDDLGLVDPTETSSHNVRLLLSIAVPAILCALAWLTEDIYKASRKCSVQSANKTASNANDLP